MDEAYITNGLLAHGFQCRIVKKIWDKKKNAMADYAFIDFSTAAEAEKCVAALNGSVMCPQTGHKWKLNWAEHTGLQARAPEYAVFVGDISRDVTDFELLEFFRQRFPSTQHAHCQKNEANENKGFGFVRFKDQAEQLRAVDEMQGALGCGTKPLRIDVALPKNREGGKEGLTINPLKRARYGLPGGPDDDGSHPVSHVQGYGMGFEDTQISISTGNWKPNQKYAQRLAQLVEEGRRAAMPKNTAPDPRQPCNSDRHNQVYMADRTMDGWEMEESTSRCMFPPASGLSGK